VQVFGDFPQACVSFTPLKFDAIDILSTETFERFDPVHASDKDGEFSPIFFLVMLYANRRRFTQPNLTDAFHEARNSVILNPAAQSIRNNDFFDRPAA